MLEFFEGIAQFVTIAVQFIVNFFKGLLQLLLMIPKAISAILYVLSFFPPFITVPIIGIFSLALIIALINHFAG